MIPEPNFRTTVDRDEGVHKPTGLSNRRLFEVMTRWSDFTAKNWRLLSQHEQVRFSASFSRLHEAEVKLADLPYLIRKRAEESLAEGYQEYGDDEGEDALIAAQDIEEAIDAAKNAGEDED